MILTQNLYYPIDAKKLLLLNYDQYKNVIDSIIIKLYIEITILIQYSLIL